MRTLRYPRGEHTARIAALLGRARELIAEASTLLNGTAAKAAQDVEARALIGAGFTVPPACNCNDVREAGSLERYARLTFNERRARASSFPTAMLGEPAWDILLAAYIADCAGPGLTVQDLAARTGASESVVRRWLAYLAREELIVREPQPADEERSVITLTARSRELLECHLRDLRLAFEESS